MSTVLVTGGSGFIGGHCILQLLAAGHTVRTTVRSLAREGEVRMLLSKAGAEAGDRLSFFAADLERDAGWAEAVAGCDYVLHVASPFPSAPPHEDELIVPAREGALRLLRAARDAGVKRVVLTSSFAAIGYGQPQRSAPFTEADWTKPDGDDTTAYAKSKTPAERAAWDFIAVDRAEQQLRRAREVVRDVADLHIRAMTDPKAKGERFLAVAGDFLSMHDIAMILKRRLGATAAKVPTRQLPNWMVRLVGVWDPAVRLVTLELGKTKNATNEKARRLLGWTPRSNEDCIVATGESLVRLGLLKGSAKKAA